MIRSRLAHDFVLSPNIEPRRNNRAVDMLLLHYTGMAQASAARDWLCNSMSGVSCHYLVDEQGMITQMVGEEMRAWHAGQSIWRGETDTNSRSIGIEIQNPGHKLGYADFPDEQMSAVILLCRDILTRHDIPARNVLGHSDVAPGRKIDPGEHFAWEKLHGEGIGHCVAPVRTGDGEVLAPAGQAELQRLLAVYGYGVAGIEAAAAISAFQRHFRRYRVDGIGDLSTLRTLERLAEHLPG